MRTYIILRQLRVIVKINNERVFKMKDKILMICLFFVLMAVLPLGFITKNVRSLPENQTDTNTYNIAYISKAAEYCNKDFCDEAVKAIAIIVRTNSKASAEQPSLKDNNSNSELYKRIEQYYKEDKSVLRSMGQPVEIPVCRCTDGFTSSSPKYEYLTAVASPWDSFSTDRDNSGDFSGISAEGIDYLCKNGMKAEEALKWYLPKLEIK